jgi:hypothetical protein
LLDTLQDVDAVYNVSIKKREFKCVPMTWRAISDRPLPGSASKMVAGSER